MKQLQNISLFVGIGAGLLLAPYPLPLNTAFAVDVEPMRMEKTIPADKPSHGTLQLTNPTGQPAQIRVGTGPYRFLEPGDPLPSAQDWLRFDPNLLILQPGESAQVTYTLTPPPSVLQSAEAEYLAAILIDHLPLKKSEMDGRPQSRITVVPRLALPVYFKIKGRERIEVTLQELKISVRGSEFEESALLEVATTLENLGSVHVRPSGSLALFHEDGSVLRARPLGKSIPLLPQASLRIPALFPLPEPGAYKAVVTIDAEQETLLQKELSFVVTSERTVLQGE